MNPVGVVDCERAGGSLCCSAYGILHGLVNEKQPIIRLA
jgi:hypothetical protein